MDEEEDVVKVRELISIASLMSSQAAFDISIANSVLEYREKEIERLEGELAYWRPLGRRYLLIKGTLFLAGDDYA